MSTSLSARLPFCSLHFDIIYNLLNITFVGFVNVKHTDEYYNMMGVYIKYRNMIIEDLRKST